MRKLTILLVFAFILCLVRFCFATPASVKMAPCRISFELSNQGAPASMPQLLKVSIKTSFDNDCRAVLTPQALTTVIHTSSADDFILSQSSGTCEEINAQGVKISFKKDGEYRVFGEATSRQGAAAEGYCFIVRQGKVYGARFFDDVEGVIILENNKKLIMPMKDAYLKMLYQGRMKERDRIKHLNGDQK